MMKHFLSDIALFILTSLLWLAFLLFLLCCIPCAIFDCIRKAYDDDRATIYMHRRIEDYLRSNRNDDEYYQIHAW